MNPVEWLKKEWVAIGDAAMMVGLIVFAIALRVKRNLGAGVDLRSEIPLSVS